MGEVTIAPFHRKFLPVSEEPGTRCTQLETFVADKPHTPQNRDTHNKGSRLGSNIGATTLQRAVNALGALIM